MDNSLRTNMPNVTHTFLHFKKLAISFKRMNMSSTEEPTYLGYPFEDLPHITEEVKILGEYSLFVSFMETISRTGVQHLRAYVYRILFSPRCSDETNIQLCKYMCKYSYTSFEDTLKVYDSTLTKLGALSNSNTAHLSLTFTHDLAETQRNGTIN